MSTLDEAIDYTANDEALILPRVGPEGGTVYVSFQQLGQAKAKLREQLARQGISRGSTLVTALPNSYEFIVLFLAATSLGAIVAPVNPVDTQAAFEFRISNLGCSLVLVPRKADKNGSAAVRAAASRSVPVSECYFDGTNVILQSKGSKSTPAGRPQLYDTPRPRDPALILYTSGTTGLPKAVPLSHMNITVTMRNIVDSVDLNPRDRTVLIMPLFHAHGLLGGLLSPLSAHSSVVVPHGGFKASSFWYDYVGFHANWYTAVPTIHQILLQTTLPPDLPTKPKFRFVRSCSSPLTAKTFQELEKKFETTVIEAYAITEGTSQVTSNFVPSRGTRKAGSVGVGVGVEVKILDENAKSLPPDHEGEIGIRGDSVTAGYRNNEEANKQSFTADGFFKTGDRGKLDADGFLYITGRTKEMINKGGEKISPVEMDNVLAKFDGVLEAVTFSIADEHFGENIGAAVIVDKEADSPQITEGSLKNLIAQDVPKFKVPKRIWLVDRIPKTATGKIQRAVISKEMVKLDKPNASKL